MQVPSVGAAAFGVVVGWICYRTLRRATGAAALSDISTVIGAVGGAAVTGLFKDPWLFGWYCVGLASGFFAYLLLNLALYGAPKSEAWMG